jgi:ribosomal protein S12 methylthiotransferase
LGCPKNLVDSEKLLGLLAEAGCPIVAEGAGGADVLVVNTCGFLAAARDEALEVLHDAARRKRRGEFGRLVVAGCLAQRDGQRLIEQVPEIDALVGVNNRRDIVRAVVGEESKSRKVKTSKSQDVKTSKRQDHGALFLGEYHAASWVGGNRSDRTRLRLTPRHYAYLRISEGCDQQCTFCTIPGIRGPMHSKGPDEILAEAGELIEDGAVELNLIGQDTTGYGRDIGYQDGLAGLLHQLNSLDGVEWIRLMYAYPADFSDRMIGAIADCDRVVNYIDLPLQHINDRVLKAMYRRVTRRETETLLEKLRKRIPDLTIRTTFIAGFPGETDAEFDELRSFIRAFRFDALGVFPYSDEPGTPSYRMKGQVPPEVVEARVEELMLTQQEIAFSQAAAQVGKHLRVLIDEHAGDDDCPPPRAVKIARHAGQAPEVDSVVHVSGGNHEPGAFVTVRCTATRDYDLVAEPCDD